MTEVHFRSHRGSLEESLKTTVVVHDRKDLIDHLRGTLAPTRVAAKDVRVRHYCYDHRTGWNTFIVTLKGDAVGFTDRQV